ncbi:unknown [Methanothermobacter thermautotrophicus str. Delta H]|uniref:Uncharacterized protein n=1 Tax=Methanothermobacter thermautotrophicus (strain ATCC 29096 / DSM 1053 / JCM 10044 / NBRC 100330 / Delta H) TaxID=187420 RepID=O26304_METTH|nr:unknown [Methanothermobacter thermautotrophicus str. Delta H]
MKKIHQPLFLRCLIAGTLKVFPDHSMRRLPPDDQLTDFNTLLGRGKYRACQILTCTTALKTILYYFYSVNPGNE